MPADPNRENNPISHEHYLNSIPWNSLRICVLQPDYSTTQVDYKYYDPVRNLAPLLPEAQVDHVLLNKLTTYKQLKSLARNRYDIFVNLCEGYLEWEIPSIDVIHSLEALQLPFTGPSSQLYDPPKSLMKYVAFSEGVATPAYALVECSQDLESHCGHMRYPLFVKPEKAGDSLGIDASSLVHDADELRSRAMRLLEEYDTLLVEEYIDGREFTILVAAKAGGGITAYRPVEYVFPEGYSFKTYSLKTAELHPDANVPVTDEDLVRRLTIAAEGIFRGFNGVGYGRLDFRMNGEGQLYFLEINFTCSVFYEQGYEGSADYILRYDGAGPRNFLRHIISEGIYRHGAGRKTYKINGNAIAGYGIYATREIQPNEVIFKGEEAAQRIVTRRYVEQRWPESEKENFRRYAYPLSKEVFLLWDNNPAGWAPQNHSCAASTFYDGLNVVANRLIAKGEELTLDYTSFLDEHMEPFQCRCGASDCRGLITGLPGNTVTERESRLRG
jgi:D-alanine-D-alanine ligase